MNIQSFTPRTAKKVVKQDFVVGSGGPAIALSDILIRALVETAPSFPYGQDFRDISAYYSENGDPSNPFLSVLFKIKSISVRLTSVVNGFDRDVTILDRKGYMTFGSNSLKKMISLKDTKYGQ